MDGVFSLALDKMRWLGVRQARVAENIANVNTPSYKARDIAPFGEIVAQLAQAQRPGSTDDAASSSPVSFRNLLLSSQNATLSGNSVNVEDELLKLSDNSKSYALSANVTRVYHRLVLGSLKGSA